MRLHRVMDQHRRGIEAFDNRRACGKRCVHVARLPLARRRGVGHAFPNLAITLVNLTVKRSILAPLARIQNELAQERDLLRILMDHIPDTIYFKDAESRSEEHTSE